MRIREQQTGLTADFRTGIVRDAFRENANSILGLARGHSNASDHELFAQAQTALSSKQRDNDLLGQKSGSVESVIKASAMASKNAQEAIHDKQEREAEQLAEDLFFLALLQNGELDGFVASEIFGGMSANEIADVVRMIERETGMDFEDYAKRILGDQMPERLKGESETEYNRRVLKAVTDEVLNDDLSIKAGYENDRLRGLCKGMTSIKAQNPSLIT